MATQIHVNGRTVVHSGTSGVTPAFPDVCKTPSPAGPVPIPYPNIAKSSDTSKGSQKVTCDGQPIMLKDSEFAMSTGDEAGSAGNVVTNKIKGPAHFIMYSFDVTVEGKNVPRQLDTMLNNCNGQVGGTPPAPCLQAGGAAGVITDEDDDQGPIKIEWEGE